jgi:hypothetical protein
MYGDLVQLSLLVQDFGLHKHAPQAGLLQGKR